MGKKILLHIGPHKTGSTSIQYWAQKNEEILSQKGIYLPRCGRNADGNHSELAWSIANDSRSREGVFHDFLEEISAFPDHHVFVSGEEFEYLSEAGISQLSNALSGYQVKIVLTLRPQHEIIRSQYGEWLKQFLTVDEFSYFWKVHSRFSEYNYLEVVNKWARYFGLGKIVIVSLSEAAKKAEGLIGEFCHVLGISFRETEIPDRMNVSDPAELLVIWRYMLQKVQLRTGVRFGIEDQTLGSRKHAELASVREEYSSIIGQSRALLKSSNYPTSKFVGYSQAELSEIQSNFSYSNAELFKIAGRKLWDWDQNYTSSQRHASIPTELIVKFDDLFVQIDRSIGN